MRTLILFLVVAGLLLTPIVGACVFMRSSLPASTDTSGLPSRDAFMAQSATVTSRQSCASVLGEPAEKTVYDHMLTGNPTSEVWVYPRAIRHESRAWDAHIWWDFTSEIIVRVQFRDSATGEVLR